MSPRMPIQILAPRTVAPAGGQRPPGEVDGGLRGGSSGEAAAGAREEGADGGRGEGADGGRGEGADGGRGEGADGGRSEGPGARVAVDGGSAAGLDGGAVPVVEISADPTPVRPGGTMNKWVSVGIVGGVYLGFWALCYEAWFAHGTKHPFKWDEDGWFGSDTYAGGEDKIGHVFFPSLLTRGTAGLLREGGWDPVLSTVVGALATNGTYAILELKDGTTTSFSYRDVVANLLGTMWGVLALHVPWFDERFDLRVAYWPSSGYLQNFKKEGFDFNEDYSGLTFMLAYHLASVAPIEELGGPLRFVDVVAGYNTENYRPRATVEHPTQHQRLFFGFTINWQRIVDEIWLDTRHPRFGDSAGRTHRVAQFATEHFGLPFTTLRMFTFESSHEKQGLARPQ